MKLIQDQLFENIDFAAAPLEPGEYENCQFVKCNFQQTDVSGYQFIDCEFINCDLSLLKIHQTLFRDVKFKGSKMMGLLFETVSEFGLSVEFDNCRLDNSSFYKVKIRKTKFSQCTLKEVDFTEADINGSVFDQCNLEKTIFDNTNLEQVDFRTAYHYYFDLTKNKAKKSVHSPLESAGLLQQFGLIIMP